MYSTSEDTLFPQFTPFHVTSDVIHTLPAYFLLPSMHERIAIIHSTKPNDSNSKKFPSFWSFVKC